RTFRPDRFLEPARASWPSLIAALGESSGVDTSTYDGFIEALEDRRAYFKDRGAVSTDHAHMDAGTEPLEKEEAARIYAAALRGSASREGTTAFSRHMIFEMARMSSGDGLVMTLHPAVHRNHDPENFSRCGAA